MKNILLAISIIALVALMGCIGSEGLFFAGPAFDNGKVKIGVMAPLSGQTAWWGEFIRQGVDLAVNEIPADELSNVEFVWEDDKCEPSSAITAAQKLSFVDRVDYVIGPLCNEATIPTEKLFEDNKIVSITTGLPNRKIADMGPYHFSFLPEIGSLMHALAQHAYAAGDRRIAVMYIQGDYGYENYIRFKEKFEELGGKIVFEESFSVDSADMRGVITKAKASNPDGVLIATLGPNLIGTLQQMEELGFTDLPRYGINAFESPQVLKEAPTLAQGVIYPTATSSIATPPMTSYSKKYLGKYRFENDVYSANAYDTVKILLSTLKECKNEKACVLEKLSALKDYPGSNGNFSVDSIGVGQYESIMLKTVKDGKFVPYELN